MKSLDELVSWGLHAYNWLPDDDVEISFEPRERLSLDGWAVTFVGAIAFSALGPWGVLKRCQTSDASESVLDGILNFRDGELNSYQQYTLWFDDVGPPSAIIIAESLSFRSFRMLRGMDL